MAQQLPIVFEEVLQLTNAGIQPASISFDRLTMESDKYICIREEVAGGSNQVVIVDMANPNEPTRRNIAADAAIMHPSAKLIALKAQKTLQIFNLDAKIKMKDVEMPSEVKFWRFISEKYLVLVTDTQVFHWSIEGQDKPQKIFDRKPELASCQIIGYRTSPDLKWCCLVGISAVANRVVGQMQLYSVDKASVNPGGQLIEGHACDFAQFKVDGNSTPSTLMTIANRRADGGAELRVIEVVPGLGGQQFQTKKVEVFFPPEQAQDFPVAMQTSPKHDCIYLVTKNGYFHLYDLESGACIYMNRVSSETIFVTTRHDASSGIMGVARNGKVLKISVNENTLVQYIASTLNNSQLSVRLAVRNNLPGADQLFVQQYQTLYQQGNYDAAAKVAAQAPQGILRTPATIQQLTQAGGNVLLQYFSTLLERGRLNQFESLDLTKKVLEQGKGDLLKKWLQEDKLEASEQLGDLIKPHFPQFALSVYVRADVPAKVVLCFAELGEFDKIVEYAKKVNYQADYSMIMQQVLNSGNVEAAVNFASKLTESDPPLADVGSLCDVFTQRNMVQPCTQFMMKALQGDKPEQGDLQTKLIQMLLMSGQPQVAEGFFVNKMFTHYDKTQVAQLCEQAGLLHRALEHYDDLYDIKRTVPLIPAAINQGRCTMEWLVEYFSTIDIEKVLPSLKEMLKVNMVQNLKAVVEVSAKYHDQLTTAEVIKMFEEFKSFEGLFFFLNRIVNFSQDSDVHFKYIEAACKTGQMKEVERVCRESNSYDPEKVKNFLKEAKLENQLPLIIVCDKHDFVGDLVKYLHKQQMQKFIEIYVQKVNPARLPQVVGGLLDIDADEMWIKSVIMSVQGQFDTNDLVMEMEKRNRLKLVLPWLEQRIASGDQDPGCHNAIAMIYIDGNQNPERFLRENQFYNSEVVGKYCEKRDPKLAIVAYERGKMDYELLNVCNENALYKQEARYLVSRQDPELWAVALKETNEHRRAIIDQVVQTALAETNEANDITVAVKAFMEANLPEELISLLEKIVLETSAFSEHPNLQNLLIITAMKTDKTKVKEYISRLENYDAVAIANIAIEHKLFDEAFEIFSKFGAEEQAMKVLLENVGNTEKGKEFAEKVDKPETWSLLAGAQLGQGMIKEAIASYMKADDASAYLNVISRVTTAGENFEQLVEFLKMAQPKIREPVIESELLYAYARTNNLAALEALVSADNIADVEKVGDRCSQEQLYGAAKILFTAISNFSKLATALVHIGDFKAAVEAAKKGNQTEGYKEVCYACIKAKEFELAQICGLHIVVHADELSPLLDCYKSGGHFAELISLLEASLPLERAHMGIFTALAQAYAEHKQESLHEYMEKYWSRCNIPSVLKVLKAAQIWDELVFLYDKYDEFDNAIECMIDHPTEAWKEKSFKEIIIKVANSNLYYSAVTFYMNYRPKLVGDLLVALIPKLDHTRMVSYLLKTTVNGVTALSLGKKYMVDIQSNDNKTVNEALNDLYVSEGDYDSLRSSIDSFQNFDIVKLAQSLKDHALIEFRRISAYLFKRNNRFGQAVDLCKRDKLFKDAMVYAAESKDAKLCNDLLDYFLSPEVNEPESFAACCFACYEYVKPDEVLEKAWRNGIMDFAMPYMIQYVKHYTEKVDKVYEDMTTRQAEEAAATPQLSSQGQDMLAITGPGMMMNPGMGGMQGGGF